MKNQLLSFMLLALMALINIPRDIYHSCEVDVHQSSALVIDEAHEECLICAFTFSVFGAGAAYLVEDSIDAYPDYEPIVLGAHDLIFASFCEGRAPPVLA